MHRTVTVNRAHAHAAVSDRGVSSRVREYAETILGGWGGERTQVVHRVLAQLPQLHTRGARSSTRVRLARVHGVKPHLHIEVGWVRAVSRWINHSRIRSVIEAALIGRW